MLTEFCGVIMIIVSIVIVGAVFAGRIDQRYKNEVGIHNAVKGYFFDNKCPTPAKCTKEEIKIKRFYGVKIRKPSKAFSKKGDLDQKGTGVENGILEGIYGELEKAAKGGPGKQERGRCYIRSLTFSDPALCTNNKELLVSER
jgi:hypothetical protein